MKITFVDSRKFSLSNFVVVSKKGVSIPNDAPLGKGDRVGLAKSDTGRLFILKHDEGRSLQQPNKRGRLYLKTTSQEQKCVPEGKYTWTDFEYAPYNGIELIME